MIRWFIIFLLLSSLSFAQSDNVTTKKQAFLQSVYPHYDKKIFRIGVMKIRPIGKAFNFVSFGLGYKRFYIEAGAGNFYRPLNSGRTTHNTYNLKIGYRLLLNKYFSLYPYFQNHISRTMDTRTEFGFMLMFATKNAKIKWMPAIKIGYNQRGFSFERKGIPFVFGIDLLSFGFLKHSKNIKL